MAPEVHSRGAPQLAIEPDDMTVYLRHFHDKDVIVVYLEETKHSTSASTRASAGNGKRDDATAKKHSPVPRGAGRNSNRELSGGRRGLSL